MTLTRHLLVATLSGCALQLGLVTQASAGAASPSHGTIAGDGGKTCFNDDVLVTTQLVDEDLIKDSGAIIHRAGLGGAAPLTDPTARDGVTATAGVPFVARTRNTGARPGTLTPQPIAAAGGNAGTKDYARVSASPVSEPSTFALLIAGLGMIITMLVRRCRPD